MKISSDDNPQWLLEKGYDIWHRARSNSFAHEYDAKVYAKAYNIGISLEVFFITTAIVSTGLLANSSFQELSNFLSVLAIISNGLALFVGIIMHRLNWKETHFQHKELLKGYSLIAQKVRRLDNLLIQEEEAVYLIRSLEESFERCKSMGVEASDKAHKKGLEKIKSTDILPFEKNK